MVQSITDSSRYARDREHRLLCRLFLHRCAFVHWIPSRGEASLDSLEGRGNQGKGETEIKNGGIALLLPVSHIEKYTSSSGGCDELQGTPIAAGQELWRAAALLW